MAGGIHASSTLAERYVYHTRELACNRAPLRGESRILQLFQKNDYLKPVPFTEVAELFRGRLVRPCPAW
jgi:hypothetical protein